MWRYDSANPNMQAKPTADSLPGAEEHSENTQGEDG